MKVQPSVKKICDKCKVIRRHGRVMVICDNLRHKAAPGLNQIAGPAYGPATRRTVCTVTRTEMTKQHPPRGPARREITGGPRGCHPGAEAGTGPAMMGPEWRCTRPPCE